MDNEREKFINTVKVLFPGDEGYVVLCEASRYEITKVTPDRTDPEGVTKGGAVMVALNGEPVRWIPKSVLAIDSQETLYIQDWFFEKNF